MDILALVDSVYTPKFLRGPLIVEPRVTPTDVPVPFVNALAVGRASMRQDYYQEHVCNAKEKGRQVYVVQGVSGSRAPTYRSCADRNTNARTALLERVFFHNVGNVFTRPFIPNRSVVYAALNDFRNALKAQRMFITPVALSEFPEKYYRGRKYVVYKRAVENVMRRGSWLTDSFLSTFLKHEKIADKSTRVVPRVIQPRKPEYNAVVGCYIRPLEHVLYQAIATVYKRPTVMKGLNAFEVGECFHNTWAQYRDPVAVGLDASRFDQHVSVPILAWEHTIYGDFFRASDKQHLSTLLARQLYNRGFCRTADGLIKYGRNGGRCSGDMNTALGNCLVMCALIHRLYQESNLIPGGTGPALFNNGDDCVLMGERADITRVIPGIPAFFQRFGFEMKVEAMVDTLEKASFCQTHAIFDGTVWRMVRDPRLSISKDATILDPAHASRYLSNHLLQVGQCGGALTYGLPILQEYYKAMRRGNAPQRGYDWSRLQETGFGQMARGLGLKEAEVSTPARVSFYRAFGVLPEVQMAVEDSYRALKLDIAQPQRLWQSFSLDLM